MVYLEKYTVDRFEGEVAVLLLRKDENIVKDVKRSELPDEVKEGDILDISFTKEGAVHEVNILKKETDLARKKAEDLLQKLLDKNS